MWRIWRSWRDVVNRNFIEFEGKMCGDIGVGEG